MPVAIGNHWSRMTAARATCVLRGLLWLAILAAPSPIAAQGANPGAEIRVIPLFRAAGNVQQGFARIINHSDRPGTVQIRGTDDAGRAFGPVTLSLGALETAHFNSSDLESGNASKGLPDRLGDGEGDWRIRLESDLDVEVGAYIRTPDGFLSSVHEVVRTVEVGGETVHHVPIFNPGSNPNQESSLRLVNLTDATVNVTIEGRDDEGRSAPGGDVELDLPRREARRISAQELESGAAGFTGSLGDGAGKWQLFVTADGPIEVVSLMQTPTGHLTNLSVSGLRRTLGSPARHTLPLFRPADSAQQGFARIINHSNRPGAVRIYGTDDAGNRRGPIALSLGARATRHFNSGDLEHGNASKGLMGGLGDGSGDWRLELVTDLDIEPSAYIRTQDGFLTSMHAVARTEDIGGIPVHRVPIFNPGRNPNQVSWLRVANLTDQLVGVSIEAQDDAGRVAPEGFVLFPLLPNEARSISAQRLESGDAELIGRLGVGTGKWQLTVVSDGSIEVVSLLQSPTGHLSNLSTTSSVAVETPGFEIVAEGSATVRPLQQISLHVPRGLADSDYRVLMDLSGTGAFDSEEDVIEVDGLTTDEDRILFASPMTQALPDDNTTHTFSVRVRRESDQRVSNTLDFAIEDIVIPSQLAGYSTTALEFVLRTVFTASDDIILNAEAPSIQPGLLAASAIRLGLDTTISDVQAEAVLQSLFGVSLVESVALSSLHVDAQSSQGGPSRSLSSKRAPPPSDAFVPSLATDGIRRAFRTLADCVSDFLSGVTDSFEGKPLPDENRCLVVKHDELVDAWTNSIDKIASIRNLFPPMVGRTAGGLATHKALEQLQHRNNVTKHMVNMLRTERALTERDDPDLVGNTKDFIRDSFGNLVQTPRGLQSLYPKLWDIVGFIGTGRSKLIEKSEREFGARDPNDGDREAGWYIIKEAGRQEGDVEKYERLEPVFRGDKEPIDAIKDVPALDRTVASNCKPGYKEFAVDEETSTCVFESLVEENCYAGSRRPSDVNLGESQACLYYSLDFFQSDGSCRPNFARVFFGGRWTCRWAELSPDQPHAYTIKKDLVPEDPGPVRPGGGNAITASQSTISVPEGMSAIGYTAENVPARPIDPPPPPSTGGTGDGCSGDRDSQGNRTGRWICVFSGRISFETYRTGTLHGPRGVYDAQGRPDGYFGSYDDGQKEGLWFYFWASSGRVQFETYRTGTLHGPRGVFNREGERDGSFGSYANGSRTGTWIYYDDGERVSTTQY